MKPDIVPDILAGVGLICTCFGVYMLAGVAWALVGGGSMCLGLGLYLAHGRGA